MRTWRSRPPPPRDTGNANGVRALLSYSGAGTAANLAATAARNGSGTQTNIWGTINGTGADYSESANFFKAGMITNPGTWTPTNVNACRWRCGLPSGAGDVNPRPTWQALALEVDYPTAATPSLLYQPMNPSNWSR